jgi:hypothetical protein
MNAIVKILIERDGYEFSEALLALQDARREISDGADPEEILRDDFGLEPDYVFDLIWG